MSLVAAPSPSLRALAELTGFSLATVSMALRDDPRIALATRELVRLTANRQGYLPDPALARRMQQFRQRSRAPRLPVKLAHVIAWENTARYYSFAPFREFRDGADARAKEFGYELEDFHLHDPSMSAQRLSDIFRARGIPGVILPPIQYPEVVRARIANGDPWLSFNYTACVTIGHTVGLTGVSRAVHDHLGAVELACRELQARGYRRVGLVLDRVVHERVLGRWLAGWACAHLNRAAPPAPLISAELGRIQTFDRWFKRAQPDAIITCDCDTVETQLKRLGQKTPKDIGLVDLQWTAPAQPRAAIDQRNHEVGATAVDIVLDQINRHERGVLHVPKIMLVPGRWVEGPTVRPVLAPSPTPTGRAPPSSRKPDSDTDRSPKRKVSTLQPGPAA